MTTRHALCLKVKVIKTNKTVYLKNKQTNKNDNMIIQHSTIFHICISLCS